MKIYLNLGRSKSGDYVCYVFHVLGVNQPHEKWEQSPIPKVREQQVKVELGLNLAFVVHG